MQDALLVHASCQGGKLRDDFHILRRELHFRKLVEAPRIGALPTYEIAVRKPKSLALFPIPDGLRRLYARCQQTRRIRIGAQAFRRAKERVDQLAPATRTPIALDVKFFSLENTYAYAVATFAQTASVLKLAHDAVHKRTRRVNLGIRQNFQCVA